MAFPTSVNDQITDAVTQSNVKVLGDSPAVALSNLYQANAQAVAISIQNATFAQQQTNLIYQATTTQGVNLIYAMDTEAIADGSTKIARADIPEMAIDANLIESLKSKPSLLNMTGIPEHYRQAVKKLIENNGL
jgi:hypothetical protein